jgi:hypothetical protein
MIYFCYGLPTSCCDCCTGASARFSNVGAAAAPIFIDRALCAPSSRHPVLTWRFEQWSIRGHLSIDVVTRQQFLETSPELQLRSQRTQFEYVSLAAPHPQSNTSLLRLLQSFTAIVCCKDREARKTTQLAIAPSFSSEAVIDTFTSLALLVCVPILQLSTTTTNGSVSDKSCPNSA